MKPTKEYSAMLYALAEEIRLEDGCTTASAESIEEAAERMDSQTVTISVITKERADIQADKESLLRLVTELRFALGDNGRRMQDELIGYAKSIIDQRDKLLAALTKLSGMKLNMIADSIVDEAIATVGIRSINPASTLPDERECCGTFPRTPHRSTCKNYRGKKGGA